MTLPRDHVQSLLPKSPGHQFVIYGDSCSGVPGALHEQTFAAVNAVVRRLSPQPDFILFPGDEIIGLTPDPAALRAQWKHWLEVETAWLDRRTIPMWHTTGNHTTYDAMSEDVFRDVLRLPANGPEDQKGLSYWVRRDDLLMVFIHTLWTGLGGEGHVETDWLRGVLDLHADARHKIVLGHHPVHPVNGFSGTYQREIGHEYAGDFWTILTQAGVLAYMCSHILAYDVQVHDGVLQICTAGAGTAHRMPEGIEYLHCIQAALDRDGLRYQVLDTDGIARERLRWPPAFAGPSADWQRVATGRSDALFTGSIDPGDIVTFRLSGTTAAEAWAPEQTLFTAHAPDTIAPIWLGLRGPRQTLTLVVGKTPGRSPSYWLGPDLPADRAFDVEVAFYPDMGPGGILSRSGGATAWTSLRSATATGIEGIHWPPSWSIGHGQHGSGDRPFKGPALTVDVSRKRS
ncbi:MULTISPECIES: metallophosphoesterase family protein [Methylobacterium]|uniref:metallophosphoesterase family protein n=1 Tax=Methylobacterium TaxID=407 RepID=UPI0013EA55C7|nr:metallophosphoesterase [Methylobacterium sp. DB0501]NGM36143.1 metallophosphoesterase [Methylobacterium sp. DB0501]